MTDFWHTNGALDTTIEELTDHDDLTKLKDEKWLLLTSKFTRWDAIDWPTVDFRGIYYVGSQPLDVSKIPLCFNALLANVTIINFRQFDYLCTSDNVFAQQQKNLIGGCNCFGTLNQIQRQALNVFESGFTQVDTAATVIRHTVINMTGNLNHVRHLECLNVDVDLPECRYLRAEKYKKIPPKIHTLIADDYDPDVLDSNLREYKIINCKKTSIGFPISLKKLDLQSVNKMKIVVTLPRLDELTVACNELVITNPDALTGVKKMKIYSKIPVNIEFNSIFSNLTTLIVKTDNTLDLNCFPQLKRATITNANLVNLRGRINAYNLVRTIEFKYSEPSDPFIYYKAIETKFHFPLSGLQTWKAICEYADFAEFTTDLFEIFINGVPIMQLNMI